MDYTIERKIVHHEWDEVTLAAVDFFRLYAAAFTDEWDAPEGKFDSYDYHPKFTFQNGSMKGDELWGVRNGRVYTSSNASGVLDWSESAGQYVSHVHFHRTELGALLTATFHLDDALLAAIQSLD